MMVRIGLGMDNMEAEFCRGLEKLLRPADSGKSKYALAFQGVRLPCLVPRIDQGTPKILQRVRNHPIRSVVVYLHQDDGMGPGQTLGYWFSQGTGGYDPAIAKTSLCIDHHNR